jgi:hypothetical protein
MKINGNFANNINFIEQKKSNSSVDKHSLDEKVDTFDGKTLNSTLVEDINNSLAILEVANNSLESLKINGNELRKISEKTPLFPDKLDELSEKFDNIVQNIEDILDNTIYNQKQIFYTTHNFDIGGYSFNINFLEDCCIEDFSIDNKKVLDKFETTIEKLHVELKDTKTYLEVANFNKIASLNSKTDLVKFDINKLSKNSIKEAHNINSLKSKIDFLLS